jgi:hypothetical protein
VLGYIQGMSDKCFRLCKNKAAKFAHHSGGADWESLVKRRKPAGMCALHKAYTSERAWKAIGDRLQVPSYLSTVKTSLEK